MVHKFYVSASDAALAGVQIGTFHGVPESNQPWEPKHGKDM